MSSTPNRRLQDDGGYSSGSGSGNPGHSSALKFPHDNRGTHSGVSGKVVTSGRHDTHASYDMGQDGQMPKTTPQRNDADRRAPLTPNMLFRVSGSIDSHSDHVASGSKVEFRDLKDTSKEIRAVNHEMKSDAKELQQSAKCDKYDINQSDDGKYGKHERDTYSELKGDTKLDKDCFDGSNKQLNWKDFKEQNRMKQFPDANSGNVETWHTSSTGFHGSAETPKEGPRIITRDFAEGRETVGENKVDMKGDDNFKEKDRKRKEIRHRDWGEKSDRRNNLQLGGSSGENKEVVKEEREFERWGAEKKDPLREKEKLIEKEKDHIKKESWNGSDKEASHNEKEPVDTLNKSMEPESGTLEMKKKDHDAWRNVDRAVRDRKKEKDIGIESDRADRRISHHEMETEDHGMDAEGGTEREREAFSSGVQQRKRMLRPRGSPQMGNHDPRFGLRANDIEGPQGKAEVSSVVYKIGECMQELIKLWKEFELSQANEERSQIGPTLEIRIPAEHVTATNRQVRGGQLWGTDIYTVDSDLVAVLMHVGYCRPTASPPPPTIQEFRATVRVLPPQECYISTLRNNVRSRAWGAAIGCSYLVERCCIVKKGGGIINLEPCLMHSSTMEPTLAPVAVERTMTTRAAASNALRQQKFVREVTIQFNLCMEPWLKYSISAVADKGLKKSLFTSSRLKKGEVLYVETHSCRFELCFKGERISKTAETGKTQVSNVQPITVDRNGMDVDTVVDMFRWSRCKRPLPQATMRNIGIPLPPEHVVVLEENLEWENILWSQTGVRIGGREYHLARVHFLAPN